MKLSHSLTAPFAVVRLGTEIALGIGFPTRSETYVNYSNSSRSIVSGSSTTFGFKEQQSHQTTEIERIKDAAELHDAFIPNTVPTPANSLSTSNFL